MTYAGAERAIERAIDEAHAKHGRTFEDGSLDRRLRIMVEEVGEIADAIQALEDAEAQVAHASREGDTDELERARANRDAARKNILEEVAQVGACAVRWLAEEGTR